MGVHCNIDLARRDEDSKAEFVTNCGMGSWVDVTSAGALPVEVVRR